MIQRVGQWIRSYIPLLFMWLVYAFLYAPIAVLVIFSCNNANFPAPWRGFTLEWYRELYYASQIWNALSNSLIVAICSTAIALFLSMLLLLYKLQGGRVERWLPALYVNLVIPEIILAVGLLSLFTTLAITPGIPTLIVAHTILGFGYVMPTMYQRYQEIDAHIIEASLDLGASKVQTLSRVVLPQLMPAIIGSCVFAFVLSFDDFVFAYFCAGASAQTLPLYILSMLRSEVSPVVNALFTLVLLASSALIALYAMYSARQNV